MTDDLERRRPPSRDQLARGLFLNALSKPLNVVVFATVAVAGIVIGAAWLFIVAAAVYALLAAMTFFDEDEARRVSDRMYGRGALPEPVQKPPVALAPSIKNYVEAAERERGRIERAVTGSDLPFTDVTAEVDALVQAVRSSAERANVVYQYLAEQDPQAIEQRIAQVKDSSPQLVASLQEVLQTQRELGEKLKAFYNDMEQTLAALGTIHAQIIRASVADAGQRQAEIAGQVRELRDEVSVLEAGMSEAYAQAPDT